jgi:hypothetical protein
MAFTQMPLPSSSAASASEVSKPIPELAPVFRSGCILRESEGDGRFHGNFTLDPLDPLDPLAPERRGPLRSCGGVGCRHERPLAPQRRHAAPAPANRQWAYCASGCSNGMPACATRRVRRIACTPCSSVALKATRYRSAARSPNHSITAARRPGRADPQTTINLEPCARMKLRLRDGSHQAPCFSTTRCLSPRDPNELRNRGERPTDTTRSPTWRRD